MGISLVHNDILYVLFESPTVLMAVVMGVLDLFSTLNLVKGNFKGQLNAECSYSVNWRRILNEEYSWKHLQRKKYVKRKKETFTRVNVIDEP